jgi:hypothetical protein
MGPFLQESIARKQELEKSAGLASCRRILFVSRLECEVLTFEALESGSAFLFCGDEGRLDCPLSKTYNGKWRRKQRGFGPSAKVIDYGWLTLVFDSKGKHDGPIGSVRSDGKVRESLYNFRLRYSENRECERPQLIERPGRGARI